jgi:hypothetical protein
MAAGIWHNWTTEVTSKRSLIALKVELYAAIRRVAVPGCRRVRYTTSDAGR